jgi:hypothetical protein
MTEFTFELPEDESLIVVDCKIRHHNFALAVDTGASHTIIDLTALLLIGFTMGDVIRTTQLETGNGPVDAYVFKTQNFSTLGKVKDDFEICAYDFFSNAVFSEFDGVLGLDFLRGSELIINLRRFTITLR